MEKKLLIRTVAAKLLEKIYLESDSSLKANIDTTDIISEDINKTTIQKAGQYLMKKQLVSTDRTVADTWVVTITYQGIDWLEDWYKSNN